MSTSPEQEIDRFGLAPHPREQMALFGHEEAEQAFLESYRAGRLHHAWLLGGPEGIGKATFAYRVARFLLAHGDPSAHAVTEARTLNVDPEHPAARKIISQAHPDLVVLRRAPATDKKAASTIIPVDAVRKALGLFLSTSGADGYRICIVDSLEDLNVASTNALLKIIEEPPPRSLFLLVAHVPGRTLATIRSRCRKLSLRPLAVEDVARAVRSLPSPLGDAALDDIDRAAALAGGSVRAALSLMDAETMQVVGRVRALLERLPALDRAALHKLADTMTGREAEADFAVLLETVHDWIMATVRERAQEGPARLARLIEVWDNSNQMARETQVFNLDRRPLILSLFGDLAQAV